MKRIAMCTHTSKQAIPPPEEVSLRSATPGTSNHTETTSFQQAPQPHASFRFKLQRSDEIGSRSVQLLTWATRLTKLGNRLKHISQMNSDDVIMYVVCCGAVVGGRFGPPGLLRCSRQRAKALRSAAQVLHTPRSVPRQTHANKKIASLYYWASINAE